MASYSNPGSANEEFYFWLATEKDMLKEVGDPDTCAEKSIEKRKDEEIQDEKCKRERQRQELIRAQYYPHHVNPAEILPRGMQILAEDTEDLEKGFPYPLALAKCDISLSDWTRFGDAIIGKFDHCKGGQYHHPHMYDFRIHTIAKHIEFVLDNVAEQDITFFRPRGLIMRLDMPGEQNFGLDFMDLYSGSVVRLDHPVHNLSMAQPSLFIYPSDDNVRQAILEDHKKLPMRPCLHCRRVAWEAGFLAIKPHYRDIRQKFFEGTRIVIDPITVLNNPKKAYKRGWTNWIQQCKDAKEKKSRREEKPPPKLEHAAAELQYFMDLDAYYEAMRSRPMSERIFRWPPSKQIYYDRWRGHSGFLYPHEKSSSELVQVRYGSSLKKYKIMPWIPWEDSMDKRMLTQWTSKCVVPADGIEVMVMEKECISKDRCPGPKRTPRIPRAYRRKFPYLPSEFEAAYYRVHEARSGWLSTRFNKCKMSTESWRRTIQDMKNPKPFRTTLGLLGDNPFSPIFHPRARYC
jgi:hypothetical protein